MVGIEEVAAHAGVSTATVSRALNDKPHVSKAAREKVFKAADDLGYVPSSSAYTLATGKTKNVGVVLPFVDRWFFSVVLEGLSEALNSRGLDVSFYSMKGGENQRNLVFNELLLRKKVDGVLTVAVKLTEDELTNLTNLRKPIVGIGGPISGARSLGVDDEGSGRLATQHLLSLGHTEIGIITGNPSTELEFHQPYLRQTGYREALMEAGLDVQKNWFAEADFTIPGAYHAAKQILGNPSNAPTALFCASDEMAFGAIQAAKDLGYSVPDDISVIGMDNHDLSGFYNLTTIDQKPREQAAKAANMLADLFDEDLKEKKLNVQEFHEWPVELLIRGSTAKRR